MEMRSDNVVTLFIKCRYNNYLLLLIILTLLIKYVIINGTVKIGLRKTARRL